MKMSDSDPFGIDILSLASTTSISSDDNHLRNFSESSLVSTVTAVSINLEPNSTMLSKASEEMTYFLPAVS